MSKKSFIANLYSNMDTTSWSYSNSKISKSSYNFTHFAPFPLFFLGGGAFSPNMNTPLSLHRSIPKIDFILGLHYYNIDDNILLYYSNIWKIFRQWNISYFFFTFRSLLKNLILALNNIIFILFRVVLSETRR